MSIEGQVKKSTITCEAGVMALMANPEQEVLESQVTSLVEELQELKEKTKANEEQHLSLLNSQRATLLDFEHQISSLKAEKE